MTDQEIINETAKLALEVKQAVTDLIAERDALRAERARLRDGTEHLAIQTRELRVETDRLRAELAALKSAPPIVPDGWVLVPVEPTFDMVTALKCKLLVTNRGTLINPEQAIAAATQAAPKPGEGT